ncbi:MAG: fasciclin domain-containing protein [Terricaulis sp.]
MSALSVVSVADRAGFHIFAAALRSSDYFETLEGAGPFTVFAPSDEAFKKLSKAALDDLLTHDREHLRIVLGYHVAAGKVATSRLVGKRIRGVMQAGGDVIIDGRSALTVNAARVIKPDLAARNGIVHGIDTLLVPRQAAAAVS